MNAYRYTIKLLNKEYIYIYIYTQCTIEYIQFLGPGILADYINKEDNIIQNNHNTKLLLID